jgi:hypothetical protein
MTKHTHTQNKNIFYQNQILKDDSSPWCKLEHFRSTGSWTKRTEDKLTKLLLHYNFMSKQLIKEYFEGKRIRTCHRKRGRATVFFLHGEQKIHRYQILKL